MNRDALVERVVTREQMRYALAEKHLHVFVKLAWKVLEPETTLVWNWHLTLLCEHLEQIFYGKTRNLVVNVPPRSLKSTIVTVCFPVWCWVKRPSKRFMCTSYSEGLSSKHSVDRRKIIRSDWFQTGWGHKFQLTDDQDTKTKFDNTKRGHMIATSMLGTATGLGGNVLIVDDPHDTTIAESEAKRIATLDAFDQKFSTRLDDKKKDAIIIVMQRLHVEDLTGHVLKQGDYTHLCLKAIAEENERHVFPRSGRVVERKIGDLLHPDREDTPVLDTLKRRLGSRGFAGQYQQRPVAKEGGLIKRAWIKYYQPHELPPRWEELVQSWDCTFKDGDTSDYVCGGVLGRFLAKKYLLPWICNERLDVVDTMRAMQRCEEAYPAAYAKLIEDKANGPAIIRIMSEGIDGSEFRGIPGIIAVTPEGTKESRLQSHEPEFEAGNIYFPHPEWCPWIVPLIEQLVNFPAVPNDDFVDMLTQGLDRLRAGRLSFTENLVQTKPTTMSGGFRNGGDRW